MRVLAVFWVFLPAILDGVLALGDDLPIADKALTSSSSYRDTFNESLEVVILGSGTHALVSWQFVQSTWLGCSLTTFPWAVRRIATAEPLSHLTLSLTRGRWDYVAWGIPDVSIYPPGAEVAVRWAHSSSGTGSDSESIHRRHWTRLQHRLSGLMCASLNLLHAPHTAPPDPIRSVGRSRDMPETCRGSKNNNTCPVPKFVWHVGLLPREAVCTENLTPWLQLLPCRGKAGLAALLADTTRVLAGAYHSMNLDIQVIISAPSTASPPPKLLLTQRFTAVLQLDRPMRDGLQDQDPSTVLLKHLLPATATAAAAPCPAADSSVLIKRTHPSALPTATYSETDARSGMSAATGPVHKQPVNSQQATLTRTPASPSSASSCGHAVRKALQSPQDWGSVLAEQHLPQPGLKHPLCLTPALTLHAALLGTGLHTSQLHVQITQLVAKRVAPAAVWPRGSLLGLAADSPGLQLTNVEAVPLPAPFSRGLQSPPSSLLLAPPLVHISRDRGRSAIVVMCMALPPHAHQIILRWRFTRAFLSLDEQPPDAHRGHDIPPPRLHYIDMAINGGCSANATLADEDSDGCDQLQQVLGPGLLLRLATADVAMPYNVICLTSTVLAVFLGATLNTLMQRSPKVDSPNH